MKKIILAIMVLIIFFGWYVTYQLQKDDNQSQDGDRLTTAQAYYSELKDECKQKDSENCCLSSVEHMENAHAYKVENDGECDYGYKKNLLRCKDSFTWCEKSHNLEIDPVYYETLLEDCNQQPIGDIRECCINSVKTMEVIGGTVAHSSKDISTACNDGFERNMLNCYGSLAWCETANDTRENTTSPVPDTTQIICTMEVKQCLDGTFVERTGSKCKFEKCLGKPLKPDFEPIEFNQIELLNNVISEKDSLQESEEVWQWYYPDGQLGELGFKKNSKKEGPWKWYYFNGEIKAEGFYKNNKPINERKWYYRSGIGLPILQAKGHYNDNGKKNGIWEWYFPEGTLRSRIIFDEDKPIEYYFYNANNEVLYHELDKDLIFKNLTENGTMSSFAIEKSNKDMLFYNGIGELIVIFYNDKLKTEEQRVYDRNYGELSDIRKYSEDKKTGKWEYYHNHPNGFITWSENYKDDVRQGPYRYYHDNGVLERSGEMFNDKQVGEWKLFHEDGSLKAVGFFKDGELSGEWKYYDEHGNVEKN